MAVGNVVPGRRDLHLTWVRCWNCGTLYTTDETKQIYKTPVYNGSEIKGYLQWMAFEKCPVCGNETNSDLTMIPAWKFKLIRWWREKKRSRD